MNSNMDNKKKYSIGEIALICGISIQTLRYYDTIELISPSYTDYHTGYRYYFEDKIVPIKIILQLKELGFPLKKIKDLLEKREIPHFVATIKKQKQKIQNQIRDLQKKEKQLSILIEQTTFFNQYDNQLGIEIVTLPEITAAYTRYNSPCNPASFSKRYNELQNIIKKNKLIIAGPFGSIFYDDYRNFDYDDADIEVFIPVEKKSALAQQNHTRVFKEQTWAKIIHKGPYDTTSASYAQLFNWLEDKEYKLCGPSHEIYLIDAFITDDPNKFITELRIPVKKT